MKHLLVRWPLMLIFIIWIFFSSPYFIKGHIPFPSRYLVTFFSPWQPYYGMPTKNNAMPDIITQIFPWRKLSIESLKEGGFGLWNPYSFSGTVHAGNYQAAPFHLFNILFFFLPFIDAWSFLVLLQPLLAGLFTYMYVRSLSLTKMSAILGSIAFMFCGFLTVWMGYATLGYAVCFLPLILFTIEHISKRKSSWWYGCVLSLSLAASFLAGHFQMSLYIFIVILGYALFKDKQTFLKTFLFSVLGIFLASPQLSVAFTAFFDSNRNESFIANAGIPFQYLITLLSPDFFGNPVTRNDWFGQYAEWASYIGVVPFFFAIMGLFISRNKKNTFLYVLFLISILLSTASPISQLFYALHIPVLSTSVATRMIVFVSFSLAIFAAFGFDHFQKNIISLKDKHTVLFILGWTVLLGIVWGLILYSKLLTADQFVIAKRNFLLPTGFIVFSCSVLLIGKYHVIKKLAIVLIILFTSFDLLRFSTKWMPFEERAYIFPQVPVISFLQNIIGENRVFSNAGNEMNTYFHLPSIEGYDALYQSRYGEFISAAADGSIKPLERSVVKIDRAGKYTKRWLDILGVKYILHRLSDGRNVWVFPHWNYTGFASVYKDDQYEVFENVEALPRAFLASSYTVETNKQEIIKLLASADFELRETLVLEKSPRGNPMVGPGESHITSYKPHEIAVDVDTSTAKLLYLSDAYTPGWNAYLDGKKIEIYRSNYAFRSVFVPEGKHTVVFIYQPREFSLAIIFVIGSVFVLLIGSVRQLRYGHRNI